MHKINKEIHASNHSVSDENNSHPKHLFLKVDKKIVKVKFEDILLVESLKDYVLVKTIYEDLIVHFNLQSFTKLLPESKFIRIHRSFTIAIDKVYSISGNIIEIGSHKVPIGRMYKQEVKSILLGDD